MDGSETDRLDEQTAHQRRDQGGLTQTQREQLDRLLAEAGEDPQIKAALAAMFYISLHQDNAMEMHIVAHREALRDDISTMMEKVDKNARDQIDAMMHVVQRLDQADATRRARFQTLEETQDRMRHELRDQRMVLRAQAWMIWTIAGLVVSVIIIGAVYILIR